MSCDIFTHVDYTDSLRKLGDRVHRRSYETLRLLLGFTCTYRRQNDCEIRMSSKEDYLNIVETASGEPYDRHNHEGY